MPRTIETRQTVIDWSELKHGFLAVVEHGEDPGRYWSGPHAERVRRLHRTPDVAHRWEGGSGADTIDMLKHGFKAPEFRHAAARVPAQKRRRSSWNPNRGRVSGARLSAGDQNFYRRPVKRDRKPGLKLVLGFGFSAATDAPVIREYGTWAASLIKGLERSGFDLTVDLRILIDDLFPKNRQGREEILVRVKRGGERADFTEWSAIFGPTGYRHLIFTAKQVVGEKLKAKVSNSLGHCIPEARWELTYDKATQTITVTTQQVGGNGLFPAEILTAQAKDAGLI